MDDNKNGFDGNFDLDRPDPLAHSDLPREGSVEPVTQPREMEAPDPNDPIVQKLADVGKWPRRLDLLQFKVSKRHKKKEPKRPGPKPSNPVPEEKNAFPKFKVFDPATVPLNRRTLSMIRRTQENLELLCSTIRDGVPISWACKLIHVSMSTIEQWRKEDEALNVEIDAATSRHMQLHIKNIKKIAFEGKQWMASAWCLERGFPQDFGSRTTITHEQSKLKELENNLHEGRARVHQRRQNESVEPGTVSGDRKLLQ